ncbi:hypothetical protein E2C01_066084 [Portunus trituberculatus]|uniref:Uncharacterized protein n=1 Tax=Portunus trituberculatus TaxID=210409 RepID=A0A5B7HTJ7_PORTR|nr:hypothetical protein [Portunus trituberculatus]
MSLSGINKLQDIRVVSPEWLQTRVCTIGSLTGGSGTGDQSVKVQRRGGAGSAIQTGQTAAQQLALCLPQVKDSVCRAAGQRQDTLDRILSLPVGVESRPNLGSSQLVRSHFTGKFGRPVKGNCSLSIQLSSHRSVNPRVPFPYTPIYPHASLTLYCL